MKYSILTLSLLSLALIGLPATASAQSDGSQAESAEPARRGVLRRPGRSGTPTPTSSEPAESETAEESGVLRRPERAEVVAPGIDPDSLEHLPDDSVEMSNIARPVSFSEDMFRPDPSYPDQVYDPVAQREIYGGKKAVNTVRPLLELGHRMYDLGPMGEGVALFGKKNLVRPQLLVYGDMRLAAGFNDDELNPDLNGETAIGQVATRLNLDIDLKLTATERIHVLLRPFDEKGRFTRFRFEGLEDQDRDGTADEDGFQSELNGEAVTAFIEGDLGAIAQGLFGSYNQLDLPFAAGIIPLLFQNGTWFEDAITGVAFTIPAMNSPALDISNMDFTFFAGFDRVSIPALAASGGDDDRAKLFGMAGFIEANRGYWEFGYGYVQDDEDKGPDAIDRSFHSLTVAHTRRFGNWLSNSVRVIGTLGQDEVNGAANGEADGVALFIENSLITSLPYTLVPYFNVYYGDGTPQSLARDAGAGGLLKTVGINFETDGLTGFPKLDDQGADQVAAAVGLEYLFGLDQQLVVEIAALQRLQEPNGATEKTQDIGLGLRWQKPFLRQWIVRADAIVGRANIGEDGAGVPAELQERDLSGIRLELRVKF